MSLRGIIEDGRSEMEEMIRCKELLDRHREIREPYVLAIKLYNFVKRYPGGEGTPALIDRLAAEMETLEEQLQQVEDALHRLFQPSHGQKEDGM